MKRRGRQPKESKVINEETPISEETPIEPEKVLKKEKKEKAVKEQKEPKEQKEQKEPKAKKESKKKQFPVVAIVTPDGIEGGFIHEQRRPLIAHMPIHSSEVIFHDTQVKYDKEPPKEPQPFDTEFEEFNTITSDSITGPAQTFGFHEAAPACIEEVKPVEKEVIEKQLPLYINKELLVSYKGSKESKQLPDSTDVACFWCCHAFDTPPCVIPIREEQGVWEVYGNFCCPECAMAALLDEKEGSHTQWERIALLHRLYSSGVGGRIYPAPSKAILRHFGGDMTIESYRETIRARKVRVDIHIPPMISILATMDTKPIDFYETTIPKSFIPLNTDRVAKVEEGLRLKRSKPLKDRESTLDACMNLQIRRIPVVKMEN
jgi:hypothetical protein